MTPLVIYHANCRDGLTAAAIVLRAIPDAECLAMNYGEELPPLKTLKNREIYIVDFSFPAEVMQTLCAAALRVVVLDHHKTAIEKLRGFSAPNCVLVLNVAHSGAMLAWNYFNPGAVAPDMVKWVEDRDLWRFKYPETKAFNEGLFYELQTPEHFLQILEMSDVSHFDNDAYRCIETILDGGKVLLQAKDFRVQAAVKHAHRYRFNNTLEVLASNSPTDQSEIGNELAKRSDNGIGMVYYVDGSRRQVNISLRSVGDVDVAKIAQGFGGGGHKNAAGCSLPLAKFLYIGDFL